MQNLVFRSSLGAIEAPSLLAVHEACFQADQINLQSPEEYRPNLKWYANELANTNLKDWIVTVLNNQIVAYGHTLWNWQERDATEVYLQLGWVMPAFRGQGIGSALLSQLEQRCQEKAESLGHSQNLEIAANASDSEIEARALLLQNDYFVAFTMLEMRLSSDTTLELPLPIAAGYEIRPVQFEHHLAIWQCVGDAYDTRNIDNPRFAEAIRKEDFKPYFSGDSTLWFVAWELQSERIAGQVLCRLLENDTGEVYEVSIGAGHRLKGIAKTLLLRALHELRARGATTITLGTRQENATQAWRLYEQVGFRTVKTFPRWRKKRDQI
jgi:mycothiol synthase